MQDNIEIKKLIGRTEYYKNGLLHREGDLPAVVCYNKYGETDLKWYKNGLLHREEDLPAVTSKNGAKKWYWKKRMVY